MELFFLRHSAFGPKRWTLAHQTTSSSLIADGLIGRLNLHVGHSLDCLKGVI